MGPLVIRDGTVDDALAIEAVHYASREAVYKDRTSDWPPRGLDRSGRVARWMSWLSDPEITCLVADGEGDIAGFCTIRRSGDPDATSGTTAEMPTLYVRPDSWSRGVGRRLCDEAIERARAQGFDELTLWVLELNGRAQAFYEEFGFAPDGTTKVDEATSEGLVAHRYRIRL
ncbi:MAG: GNAT family N-acetyltransferase [Gemmatimonadota bacterium]